MDVTVILILFISLVGFSISQIKSTSPKIAIVGGGIGGTSAAYNLRKLFGNDTTIDLFEPNNIGGRIKLVDIGGRQYEAGASIIHISNHYMVNFTKLLGLKFRDKANHVVSIVDEDEVKFSGSSWQFVNLLEMIWKYGLDIYHLNSVVTKYLEKFTRIYQHQQRGTTFTTVRDMLMSMDSALADMCFKSLKEVLSNYSISEKFIDEFAAAGIRINYGQLHNVHAFVGFVTMAAMLPGLWSVHGGNNLVAKGLVDVSRVNVLKSEVISITHHPGKDSQKYNVRFMYASDSSEPLLVNMMYDVVVIATPLHEGCSDIVFENFDKHIKYSPDRYHRTVATFVQGTPNSTYFHMPLSSVDIVLTNSDELPFNSIGLQLPVDWTVREGKYLERPVYKVFSQEPLNDSTLRNMFVEVNEVQSVDWFAYPHYSQNIEQPNFVLHEQLYYVNAIEVAASAMEMSAISAKNVALLIYDSWVGSEQSGHSDAPNKSLEKDEL